MANLVVVKAKVQAAAAYVVANRYQLLGAVVLGKFGGAVLALVLKAL